MPSRIVITSKRDPKVTLEYSSPKSSVSFADLKASSFVDADSPHKWDYDTYTITDDEYASSFSKQADADSFVMADNDAISFTKPIVSRWVFNPSPNSINKSSKEVL